MYAGENNGIFYPRTLGVTNQPRWPEGLKAGYLNVKILRCPSDGPETPATFTNSYEADSSPRTYMINGWNDYFKGDTGTNLDMNSIVGKSMPENAIHFPSDTIFFGEKKTGSGQFFMDLEEGKGNDYDQLNQARHSGGAGSDYAFADGSVRFYKLWRTVGSTFNLWAVTEAGRTNYAFSIN
ncbi:MAG: prepilin-type cleavage/methylation domain-containing protein, partial [Verrucomicrobiota bacterium]|nr:prepilin-type cleavage/methylation domain-containing protein [Verrucomicrobiota bacterium]